MMPRRGVSPVCSRSSRFSSSRFFPTCLVAFSLSSLAQGRGGAGVGPPRLHSVAPRHRHRQGVYNVLCEVGRVAVLCATEAVLIHQDPWLLKRPAMGTVVHTQCHAPHPLYPAPSPLLIASLMYVQRDVGPPAAPGTLELAVTLEGLGTERWVRSLGWLTEFMRRSYPPHTSARPPTAATNRLPLICNTVVIWEREGALDPCERIETGEEMVSLRLALWCSFMPH